MSACVDFFFFFNFSFGFAISASGVGMRQAGGMEGRTAGLHLCWDVHGVMADAGWCLCVEL